MKSSRSVQLPMFAMVVFGGVETTSASPVYSFTTIDVPGATSTSANGINNSGQIVGYLDFGASGSFLDTGGIFTTIAVPGASNTIAWGINDSGQIVGNFSDAHGFVDTGGSFTSIDVPGASFTSALGINDSGQIVGVYMDATGTHGFLDTGGIFTAIDAPGAIGPYGTTAAGINNSGQIVGGFNFGHGFVDTGGSFTIIDVPGAGLTSPLGINDSGQIVGNFSETRISAFLATPVAVPEPPTSLTLVTSLVALCAMAWRRKRANAGERTPLSRVARIG